MDRITATKTARLADDCHKIFSLTKEIKDAISKTRREEFVPAGFRHNAYKLDALPLSSAQWISSPLTVAKMTHYLEPQGADRVLEVGCGSGYQAAVLSHLFRGVFTIERIESLMIQAKNKFKKLGIHNIHTRTDDGQNGWVQYAPYDRILFSATAKEIPQKLFEQLSDGGILVAPMQKGTKQIITRFRKSGDSLTEEELEECDFVPVLDGVQK
ncbi:MAG: protein-L-isoaspartate(D-aspartate) O-methyltransferase [Sulfurimonas sp.]|uniref:protein-L-isoaspartate(D-aspartate) O-methyltransferase n=1 Tax=Sulfurimonas sp. TaxID=2022749 RepID=UPI0026129DC7|nr:protein-L-isoaspartate(D-aspartate) O-methyltransferase [Sulfurimonas sp.]MCW8896303.1 protein-L-isoaspartate(D-aspartate) O-methyltransferase [Sulfurimonas sp.]MCW8954740.1 protein-L-isoaspartate(D-aspartate) O-methyltransferase [Sulfurimonas sp.]MCW9068390.1 protein-L-isoaspartate(D-aspartate) O-methyltransferase [Sulfurimonas sp.]